MSLLNHIKMEGILYRYLILHKKKAPLELLYRIGDLLFSQNGLKANGEYRCVCGKKFKNIRTFAKHVQRCSTFNTLLDYAVTLYTQMLDTLKHQYRMDKPNCKYMINGVCYKSKTDLAHKLESIEQIEMIAEAKYPKR